jgi:hypothetical protein
MSQRTPRTTQPAMVNSALIYDNEWAFGICDCCSDCGECLFAYCCFAWFEFQNFILMTISPSINEDNTLLDS